MAAGSQNGPVTDPFATAETPPAVPDDTIVDGATVLAVERHPVYGLMYRCRTWMAHYPWVLRRGDPVMVFRGNTTNSPVVGPARVKRVRRNGVDVAQVPVGINGEPLVELFLDRELAVETGDMIAVGRGYLTEQELDDL